MLFPLPLLTAAPLGRRPEATAARRRPPSRPDRPGTTPPELRPGIGPAGLPDPFPLTPEPPRAPGRRIRHRRRATSPSPVSQREGRKRTGQYAQNPLAFPLFSKETSHLLTFLQKKPLLLLYFKTDPPTL